jgi:hypothetical protein
MCPSDVSFSSVTAAEDRSTMATRVSARFVAANCTMRTSEPLHISTMPHNAAPGPPSEDPMGKRFWSEVKNINQDSYLYGPFTALS